MTATEVEPNKLAHMKLIDFLPRLVRDKNSPKRRFLFEENASAQLEPEETQKGKRRILFIDQFEELFTMHKEDWENRADFFEQLAQAMEANSNLWVVLVMREDFIAYLDPYAHLLPGGLRVRYYMQRMEYEDALKAVRLPVKDLRPYTQDAGEQLTNDLRGKYFRKRGGKTEVIRGQYIEPIVLQAVCATLWENLKEKEGDTITLEDVKSVGDVDKALGIYYEKRVHEVAELAEVKEKGIREADIRNWFGTQLITAEGRRNIVVRKQGGRSGGLDDSVVQLFSKRKELVRDEEHSGVTIYELTHDRLAEPILENNKDWEREYGFPFHQQAERWSEAEGKGKDIHLLGDEALEEAEQWVQEHPERLSGPEEKFLGACRAKKEHELQEREQEREIQRQKLEAAQNLIDEKTRSVRMAIVLSMLLVIFSIMAAIAAYRFFEAQKEANSLAAGNIANLAAEITDTRPELSILLSIGAYKKDPTNSQAQAAMFKNIQRKERVIAYLTNSENPAKDFAISPDGTKLAVYRKKSIILYKTKPLEEIGNLEAALPPTMEFSPNNRTLAVVDNEGIRLVDTDTDKPVASRVINDHVGTIQEFANNKDDKTILVSRGENNRVVLWNWKAGIKNKVSIIGENIFISPKGNALITISTSLDSDGIINIWNLATVQKIGEDIKGDNVTFSPDGSLFAVIDKDGSISVWQTKTAEKVADLFSELKDDVDKIAIGPDSKYLILSSKEKTYILDWANEKSENTPPLRRELEGVQSRWQSIGYWKLRKLQSVQII